MAYSFQFRDVFAARDALQDGLELTLQLTATTIGFGLAIGLCVAAASTYGGKALRGAAQSYVELIRNTPLLVRWTIALTLLALTGGGLLGLLVVDGDPMADLNLLQEQGKFPSVIMKDGRFCKNELR